MRVDGTLDTLQQHYGSMYAMADYVSKAHNVYLSVSFIPTHKLRFHTTANFGMSKAALEPVVMPDVSDRLEGALSHQDFTLDEMHTYSDLDYKLLQFAFGIEYSLSLGVTVTADANYADLTDNTGFIYGVESGSFLLLRSGVRIEF